ncbi:hypothetical protein [Caballeronia sp. KNU42]
MPVFAEYSCRGGEPFMADSPRGREWLKNTRSVDEQIADAVRADSTGGGLKMITNHDDSGRPVRTFELEPGATKASTWMKPFTGPAYQMLRICKQPPTPAEAAAFEDQWRATQAMVASGKYTCQEI